MATDKNSRIGWIILACLILVPFLIGYAKDGSTGFLHSMWRKATFMFPDNASGTVTSSGAGGDWKMKVNACASGEHRQYWGVAFFDEDQPATGGRVVVPESGSPHLLVNKIDGPGSMQYDREQCSVWDVALEHSSVKINGFVGLKGHANFDCGGTDPVTRVVGEVTFRSCQ